MWERQEKWMASIRRAYKDEADKARRLKIFTENVEYVESFNKQEGQTYRLSITDSMDLTDKEMRGWLGKDGDEEIVEYSDNEENDLEHLKAQTRANPELRFRRVQAAAAAPTPPRCSPALARRPHQLIAHHFVEAESSEGGEPSFSFLAQSQRQNKSRERSSLWHTCLSSHAN
ncbi:hypothetical protein MRB53_015666 [Persea americana]|uniref:Uncharacterized protein n=1 Tax=Persea americana TaxID=3435 RepID=A0ACC2M1A1_PERAE|nr:hypothetical protein MRB53_015666 [Persea americana]